jgi:hypothetical protein
MQLRPVYSLRDEAPTRKIAGNAPRLKEILERHSDRDQQLSVDQGACNCLNRTVTPGLAFAHRLRTCEADRSRTL